jgi:hypothetical protein
MTAARWIVLLLLAVLVNCTTAPTVQLASPDSDATAKRFMPPGGRANLYIARSNDSASRVASFDIVVQRLPQL